MRIDPARNAVAARVLVPDPSDVVIGDGAVWVTSASENAISRIDPSSTTVVAYFQVGRNPSAVALHGGFLWVVNNVDATVSQLDAATGELLGQIPVGAGSYDVAAGGGAVWVQSFGARAVIRMARAVIRMEPARAGGFRPESAAPAAGRHRGR